MTTGPDRRWQVTTPMTARHSRVVTSRSTEHLSHESASCHKTDQISSSRSAMAKPSVRDMERVKRIGRCFSGKTESEVLVPLAAEW